MSPSFLPPQDVVTFQQRFRENGFELPNNEIFLARTSLLKHCKMLSIDRGEEHIIAYFKVHAEKPGIISWAKVIMVPVNTVRVNSVEITEVAGATVAGILEGEIFVTRDRIIYFYNSKSIDSRQINEATEVDLSRLTKAWYEDDILILRFTKPDIDCRWHMSFPRPAPAQIMSQTSSYAAKRDVDNLESKGTGARALLHRFFTEVALANQATLGAYSSESASGNLELREKAPPATSDENPVTKLTHIKQMLDSGLITESEYAAKKAEILSKL